MFGSVIDTSEPVGHREAAAGLTPDLGVVDVRDELEELHGFRWCVLADREPVAAAERVGRRTGAAVDHREREPTEVEGQLTFRDAGGGAERAWGPLAHEVHRGEAVTDRAGFVSVPTSRRGSRAGRAPCR